MNERPTDSSNLPGSGSSKQESTSSGRPTSVPRTLTPEERLERNRRIELVRFTAIEEMKSTVVADPETNEEGTFVKFVFTAVGLRPLYETPSGKNFFIPVGAKSS